MRFTFEISEQTIFQFEELLHVNGIKITPESDLENVLFGVLEINAKYKNEIIHDNITDIRDDFRDFSGIVDFVTMIVKQKNHKDFSQVVPHLHLLNKADTTVLTKRSQVRDASNNKLVELYVALLCMSFAEDVELDHPENSKGDNPDVMFSFKGARWAIACKALHSENEKTLYDTILKGTQQIERSSADFGIVLVNFKNIIKEDDFWRVVNLDNDPEPYFGCYSDLREPLRKLRSYGENYKSRLIETFGLSNLVDISRQGKCASGFLIFLNAVSGVIIEGLPTATIFKTLNLVEFDVVPDKFRELAEYLNNAIHHRV